MWSSLIIFLICNSINSNQGRMLEVKVAVMGHSKEMQEMLDNVLKFIEPSAIKISAAFEMLSRNPIDNSLNFCKKLVTQQISAVIITHPNKSDADPISVSYTSNFYQIPMISLYSKSSIFSEKTIHRYFMRLVATYVDETRVWIHLLDYYKWRKAYFFASKDHNGRSAFETAYSFAKTKNIELIGKVFYDPNPNEHDVMRFLKEVIDSPVRVVLFYGNKDDSALFTYCIQKMGLFKDEDDGNFVWITSSNAFEAAPAGTLSVQQVGVSNLTSLLMESLQIFNKAMSLMLKKTQWIPPPTKCASMENGWRLGSTLFRFLKETTLRREESESGEIVKFNKQGDRVDARYNILHKGFHGIDSQANTVIGNYNPVLSQNPVRITKPDFRWPGGGMSVPSGRKLSTHLEIVTVAVEPFVFVLPPDPATGKCRTDIKTTNKKPAISVNCTRYINNEPKQMCCHGYCIDMLLKFQLNFTFTYNLHISKDESFGNSKPVISNSNTERKKEWTGAIGELLNGTADLIIASLTIDNERSQEIDFSNPFKHQGLSIMVKRSRIASNLASFVQPFSVELWLLIFLSVHVVALIIYLLDRFSPFGNIHMSDERTDDSMTLPSALWFAWGVLLNSGIGEGTPNSFSARVLGMVWAGFAMVVVASYTANLAAFLVLDRPESEISGINDARMRNPSNTYKFGTVFGGATEAYFKRKVEMSTMYQFMQKNSYQSAGDAIKAVKNGSLDAFIWDSAVLDYVITNDCELMTVGELFHRSGYGIGLPKGSPWKDRVSSTVLYFHEKGYFEELDTDWISHRSCTSHDSQPATLGLNNMAGVFILVALGIVLGIPVVVLEIFYKKKIDKRLRDSKSISPVATYKNNAKINRNHKASSNPPMTCRMELVDGKIVQPYLEKTLIPNTANRRVGNHVQNRRRERKIPYQRSHQLGVGSSADSSESSRNISPTGHFYPEKERIINPMGLQNAERIPYISMDPDKAYTCV